MRTTFITLLLIAPVHADVITYDYAGVVDGLFYYEGDAIFHEGQDPRQVDFALGQRSVIAYIIRILNTTKQDLTGENRDRKANEDGRTT